MGSIEHDAWLLLDGCVVDASQCELLRNGERHHLTTKEVEVLTYFVRNPSRNISYEELLERVWGYSRVTSTQPVYSVVKRLRRKLDGFGEHRHIVTVHGVGYRFEPPRTPHPAPNVRAAPRESAPLPARVSNFVGRSREQAAIEAAFARGARVVSLVGMGGAGKTRLSVEYAAACTEFHGRHVVFCDLSAVTDEAGVRSALATAAGVRADDDADVSATAAVARALRSLETWVILLDNAEHVLEATARVAMDYAAAARLLVTSRERLGVPGEHAIEVGPLAPEDGEQLFRDRARSAGLALEGETTLREIVARLDGLPLAIELAAAQAGVVSLERVRHDLDRQLDRLIATRRGGPARHATLRASVEWSWELLDAAERSVLAQCAVFVGGFTVEAVEAVVRCKGSALARLVRLCECSLVRRVEATGARFALYESVRELAVERLDEREDVAQRHRAWALRLALDAGALDDSPSSRAGARLAAEADNLRAAFRGALESEPARAPELALAVAVALAPTAGSTSVEILQRGLSVATGELAVRLRLALGRWLQHRGVEGQRFLEESVALARAQGTATQQLEAERLLGACLAALGDPGAALPRLETALRTARDAGASGAMRGRLALDLGETHLTAGAVERARELLEEAARLLAEAGDPSGAARAHCALSHVHREQREYESGLAALERARRLLEQVGDEAALARLALDRGILLATRSHSAEACDALDNAVRAHRRLGMLTGELRARDWRVLALLGLARDDDALSEAREMQQLGIDLGRRVYEAERAFGAVWLTAGRLREADAAFGRALDVLAAGGKATVRGHVLSARALGRVLLDRFADAESDMVECVRVNDERGSGSARLHSAAMLALVHEFMSPRPTTDAVLDAAERGIADASVASWEGRQLRGWRAVVSIVRARRGGQSAAQVARLADEARVAMLDGAARAQDYFTRCGLLLLDHATRTEALQSR